MEVRGIVRALHSAAHRRAEAAFRDNREHCRHAGRQGDHYGDIDLLGDRNGRRRLLPRLQQSLALVICPQVRWPALQRTIPSCFAAAAATPYRLLRVWRG